MKKSGTWYEIPTLSLLVRKVLETLKTIQAIDIALDFPLEPDGIILLLKTPHSLVTIHGKINLVLTKKFIPRWLASIELEGAYEGY